MTVNGTADPARPRGRDVRSLLAELARLPGVRGGLVVAADGLVIAAELPAGSPVEALSALAATLGRELELRGPRLRRGTFQMAQLTGTAGGIVLGSTPIGFVVLVAAADADHEAVRQALGRAVETVRQAWSR